MIQMIGRRDGRHRAPILFMLLRRCLRRPSQRVTSILTAARVRIPMATSTLRLRIVLIIAVAIAVPLGTIGLEVSMNDRAEFKREAERGVLAEATATGTLIDHHLTSLLATARAITSLGPLRP